MSGTKRSGPPSRKGHLPTDLIALGSKPSGTKSRLTEELKPTTSLKQGTSGIAPSVGPPTKKLRLAPQGEGSGGLFSDPIRVSQVAQPPASTSKSGSSPGSKSPFLPSSSGNASQVIEVRPGDLVPAVREARTSGNEAKAAKMLAGGLKLLRLSRLKPDQVLNAALTQLVKEDNQLFNTSSAIEGLVSVLKREPSVIFKAKSNPSVYILASQILLLALKDSYNWPESVAKVYIEDSLGERVWVDLEPCKKLVDNICTIFQTRPYNGSSAGSSSGSAGSGSGSTSGQAPKSGSAGEGGSQMMSEVSLTESEESGGLPLDDVDVEPRFSTSTCKSLKAHVLQLVNEQLGRHSISPADSVSRNLLKFLTSAAGSSEMRLLVVQRIEGWIQNPKLGKQCQDLLMTVAVNCHAHSPEDVKVIETLVNVRLKTKLFSNQFVACIKELISTHPDNLETVFRGVVGNELGNLRSPSNMALLSMMVHSWPDDSSKLLGSVFQEFLMRKEDYLRALRGFLREVVRQVRNEFNFSSFTRSLMQERVGSEVTQLEQTHKERMALSLADLISCSCMLMANMLIREAYNGYTKGEKAMVPQLQEFFGTLGLIQRDAVWWVHTIVPNMFRPQPSDYKTCLRKVLFLEVVETYHSRDNWPPESDRSLILHLMTEACLKEDTLMRVLVIGLSRELPLSPADALDIADKLVARAANAHSEDIQRLPTIERKELFNAIFDITAYRAPPNIQLPDDYQPPSLAISKLYWKGWILLLVLSAFNPKTIGGLGWKEYPMLKGMMEMVMTNTYSFPASTTLIASEDGSVETRDNAIMRELQLSRSEKEAILQYENHLATSSSQGAAITEANSYLLNQVTLLSPKGPARRLPSSVIDLIKVANRSLKLGQSLCRCRSPDFLLDVIKKQGTLESMKWLTELVESSQSSLEVLPVPCLCEFLMASYQDQGNAPMEVDADPSSHRAQYKRRKTAREKNQERHKQLIGQLQSLLTGPQSSQKTCTEVLEYFFDRLTLSHLTPRSLALKGLQEILKQSSTGAGDEQSDMEDDEEGGSGEWLLTRLPSLSHFSAILPRICHLLLQACLVETSLHCLQSYLLFLTQHTTKELLFDSSIAVSTILVDRFEVIRKLFQTGISEKCLSSRAHSSLISLLKMLRNALETAIHSPRAPSSAQFTSVTLPSGQKIVLHTALVHATFLLLSSGPPRDLTDFNYLLEIWFPDVLHPDVYTSLIPDSVLNYMLYSSEPRILQVVIQKAEPSQLCSFVQEFGIPPESMQQVLAKLDRLCECGQPESAFEEEIKDPVHLSRCIQVQMVRGVTSGKVFLEHIQELANLPAVPPVFDLPSLLHEPDATMPSQPAPVPLPLAQIPTISQERMEQLLLQIFAPPLSRISTPPQEIQRLATELEVGLKSLITSSTNVTIGSSLNAPISGLITAIHKLVTSSSIRRQFLEGLLRSRFSISLLRLITKIQCMNHSEDFSAGLFKATIEHILATLESLKASDSTAFQAALKTCAEQLGMRRPLDNAQLQKLQAIASKLCKEVSENSDPFENEASLLRNCQYLIESKVPLVEDVIGVLVKQAIILGREAQCIEQLHKVQLLSSSSIPIALQCSPEIFQKSETLEDDRITLDGVETMDTSIPEDATTVSVACTLDLNGLLADCLELLDPDILSVNSSSAQVMVFGNSQDYVLTGSPLSPLLTSGQGYLLARLTHESSWPTLLQTVSTLMDPEKHKEWINPTAVLDFLWACLHNPCLWQGRVKKEAVVNSYLSLGIDEESQLNLTPLQLRCLVDCILNEAALCVGTKQLKEGHSTTKREVYEIPPEAKSVLYSRLPLLMCCFHGNQQQSLTTVIQHLQTHSSYPSLGWQLLVHLYLADERVILMVDHTHPLSISALDSGSPSKLDTELHNLLVAMVDAQPGQESLQRMASTALLARKIAIHHPALMIRHLSMLGWLLRGRAHLTPSEFRNRNHKHVFLNVFVLLELLQPLVFEDDQSAALESCLEPFFEFLKNQCLESKKYQNMVTKFSDFLVQFSQHNRDKASRIIYHHLDLLKSLSTVYTTKKSSLKSLVESFPMVKGEGCEQVSPPGPHAERIIMVVPPLVVGHSLTHEQVMPFLKKLEYGQVREDVLKVLQDLDETSLHSVEILKHFVPELCRIILDPEPASCKLAHSLLLRHLKQSPRAVDELIPAIKGCLDSHDRSIIMAAVASVPDLVLLCKAQDASQLLNRLFLLATQLSYNGCIPELLKAIQACTQHTFR